jgi:hypothetical protein
MAAQWLHNGWHNAKKQVWLKATCLKPRNSVFLHCDTMAKPLCKSKNTLPKPPTSRTFENPKQPKQ